VQAWIQIKPNKSKETKGTAEDAEVNPHAQINALGKEDNSSKKHQAKWRHIGKSSESGSPLTQKKQQLMEYAQEEAEQLRSSISHEQACF